MTLSGVGLLLLGVCLGYLIGWHRGVLRLTLIPKLRSGARPGTLRPVSPTSAGPRTGVSSSGTPSGDGDGGLPDRRAMIERDLRTQWPQATRAEIESGVAEIEAKGRAMFAGQPRRAG